MLGNLRITKIDPAAIAVKLSFNRKQYREQSYVCRILLYFAFYFVSVILISKSYHLSITTVYHIFHIFNGVMVATKRIPGLCFIIKLLTIKEDNII